MSMTTRARVTVPELQRMRSSGDRIVALTAYDYVMARILDTAGVDVILVGDSLGNVVQGNETTLPVTLDEMIYHARLVTRAVQRALVVVDMPFMSFQLGAKEALIAAGRIIKETGASAVKLEGGTKVAEAIRAIVDADIPVMGHIGLQPQSVNKMGGYKVQGKDPSDAERVLHDASAVEKAGAFAVVLEGIPAELSQKITAKLDIPTIGIGAGVHCSGQILVVNDLIGLVAPDATHSPKFVRRYAQVGEIIANAVAEFGSDIKAAKFPGDEQSYSSSQKPQLQRVPK